MSDLPALTSFLVGGGFSGVLVALIGVFAQRRMKRADYARALVQASGEFADRVDARNEKLEAKVDALDGKVDQLDSRIDELSGLIREAIPLLAEAGHVAMTQKMRNALIRGTA